MSLKKKEELIYMEIHNRYKLINPFHQIIIIDIYE